MPRRLYVTLTIDEKINRRVQSRPQLTSMKRTIYFDTIAPTSQSKVISIRSVQDFFASRLLGRSDYCQCRDISRRWKRIEIHRCKYPECSLSIPRDGDYWNGVTITITWINQLHMKKHLEQPRQIYLKTQP
jgi:hypothetical protein